MADHVYLKTYRILEEAIRDLACGEGNVRSRLIEMYVSTDFHILDEEHFPEELMSDWSFIIHALTKQGEKKVGLKTIHPVHNTMDKIMNKTGVKIAEKIYELKEKIEHYI
jgi:hypothetical protein